jgi:hypothetical protein
MRTADCESCTPNQPPLTQRRFECELPGCIALVCRDHASTVRLTIDGRLLKGWACTPDHAAEIVRGWSSHDLYDINTAVTSSIAALC